MKRTHLVVSLFALACGLAVSAAAQEKTLKKADLPAAVQKAVDEQSKGATIRGYSSETENGQLEYEAQMTVNGHSKDISFAPDGKVLEIEEQVMFDSLPAAVRDGLKKKAGAGTITKVESITKHGSVVAYEAKVHTGDKHSEVQVGPDGQPLSHEE